jgi:hypothetical protein
LTAEEIPSYWPPGAGRACKPLLGAFGPFELNIGTLVDGGTSEGATGGSGGGGGASAGGGGSSSVAGTSAGGASSVGAATSSGSGAEAGSGAAAGSGTNFGADSEAPPADERSGCACRAGSHHARPGSLGALTLALAISGLCIGRRAKRARWRSTSLAR